jgi:hypothetical protein
MTSQKWFSSILDINSSRYLPSSILLAFPRQIITKIFSPTYMFELMSGSKINYLKSETVIIGGHNNIMAFYADSFNCQAVSCL